VKLPRDLRGTGLAKLLRVHGYEIKRQTGSHIRLTSMEKGPAHHITIPAHKQLRVGTLSAIVSEVASYLELERDILAAELFGQ
jgi:predicted RNA binding protein YcfA (HicA-like mRNA interferase family)